VKRVVLLLSLAGCGGPPPSPARTADAARVDSSPPADTAAPRSVDAGTAPDAGELREEAPERDPRSATVKLKLIVTPAAQGVVAWGRKKLAELKPGQMTMEVERPRGSGPLDVVVRANGFLPHHVRLFTDRDDRLNVHLHRPDEAQGLLGYRRPPEPQ
jgi:hypothetical protein